MDALLRMGLNIGLSKMAEATPRLTYKQLANVSQWRKYKDAMNKAQAVLVNFHHYMQLQTHITELEKKPPTIDLRVINSLLTTQKLFILIQEIQFMFWMVYYTMRQI